MTHGPRRTVWVAGAGLVLLVGACGDMPGGGDLEDTVVVAVEVTTPSQTVTFGVDRIVPLTAVARNAAGQAIPDKSFTWEATEPAVGAVNAAGVVTLEGPGSMTVTARSDGVSGSIELTVADRPPGESVAITNVNVLTMEDDAITSDQTVVVQDGFIVEVGDAGTVDVPAGMAVVDGSGRYVMPGLVDMHVHALHSTDLLPYLATGVTSVLDMGNGFYNTVMKGWKDDVRQGTLAGPNIYVSANIRASSDFGDPRTIADTPTEGRAFVRANRDFDFIKVYNGLTTATFQATVDEATSSSMTVIGHGVRSPGMAGILSGGLKMVAHAEEFFFTSLTDVDATSAQIDRVGDQLLAAGAYVTATLSINEAFAILWGNPSGLNDLRQRPGYEFLHPDYKFGTWPDRAQNFTQQTSGSWRRVLEFEMRFLKRFHDAGVLLLLGTDSPVIPGMVPGFSLHEDLRLHVEMGLSSFDALRAGTVNPGRFMADYLAGAEPFGLVKVGYRGDLILVSANPLLDLPALLRPDLVIVRGTTYTKAELDAALEGLRN